MVSDSVTENFPFSTLFQKNLNQDNFVLLTIVISNGNKLQHKMIEMNEDHNNPDKTASCILLLLNILHYCCCMFSVVSICQSVSPQGCLNLFTWATPPRLGPSSLPLTCSNLFTCNPYIYWRADGWPSPKGILAVGSLMRAQLLLVHKCFAASAFVRDD